MKFKIPIAAIGAISAVAVILTLAIAKTSSNYTSEQSGSSTSKQNWGMAPAYRGEESASKEEISTLAAQVKALQQQLTGLRQSAPQSEQIPGVLRAEVQALWDELDALAGQVVTERNITPDLLNTENGARHLADTAELAYTAQQQYDLAESEFLMQDFDSQWAVAASNLVRDRLAADQEAIMPDTHANLRVLADTLECRTNTCRVEIPATNRDDMETLQLQLLDRTAGLFSAGTIHQTDTGDTIVFMHRDR